MKNIIFVFVTFSLYLQAQTLVEGTGNGVTKEGAKLEARIDGMLKYLVQNMDEAIFAVHGEEIRKFVRENWQEYWVKDGKVKRVGERSLVLQVVIDEERLLRDVMRLPSLKIMKKMEGMNVAILLDPDRESSSFAESQILLTEMTSLLGRHLQIMDVDKAKKLLALERREFGLSNKRNYQGNMWREYDHIRVMMYFVVTVEKSFDATLGTPFYRVAISTRGEERMTGQELFRFAHELTGNNKENTIKQASAETTEKIINKMAYYRTILPEDQYELKFVKFKEQKQRENIQKALLQLKQKKFLDILPGGFRAGEDYFMEKVKWRQNRYALLEIIEVVKEYCLLEGTQVACYQANPRILVFQPPGSNWDGASEEITINTVTIEQYILSPSSFDVYLETEESLSFKAKDLLKINFRWRQDAPQDWYFYSLYFSNKEVIYVFYPNCYEKNKLLKNGKSYTFPDQNDYLEDWGIAFRLALPSGFTNDSDQLLLIASAKPIDSLQKKAAKLKEGQIATMKWEDVATMVEEMRQYQYAHKLVNIVIE